LTDSFRGIVRTLASICFASIVGRWVDHAPHRLKTLSSTITVNRISVIATSALWFFIVGTGNGTQAPLDNAALLAPSIVSAIKGVVFALILFLGIFETLSASGNMLSMERDFVWERIGKSCECVKIRLGHDR
jgi:iron-regulated transporter 1